MERNPFSLAMVPSPTAVNEQKAKGGKSFWEMTIV